MSNGVPCFCKYVGSECSAGFPISCSIQRYAVIPLSTNSGLIGWVPHCDTLHALIRDYREKKKILLNIEHRIMLRVRLEEQVSKSKSSSKGESFSASSAAAPCYALACIAASLFDTNIFCPFSLRNTIKTKYNPPPFCCFRWLLITTTSL